MPPFVPRTTQPDPTDSYYSTWDRFYWLDTAPYGGNCTGYAYGRFGECAGQNLYNDFYITGYNGNTNAKYWMYNTWPDQTVTSGSIDLKLGDILIWGGGTYGHVEVVEALRSTELDVSYSVWGDTYGTSKVFGIRTIPYPTWGSYMGAWVDNNGDPHNYTNGFAGYIHNKYITPAPTPVISKAPLIASMRLALKRRRHRSFIKRRWYL